MFKKLFIMLFVITLNSIVIGEELRNQTYYKLYKEGKYQELGITVSNTKVKDNDDIYYMGLAYYHLGRKVEAGKVWKEYVNIEKNKSIDKWIATFPPKNDESWKDKTTNAARTEFRKINYLTFENKYKDAIVAYEATINKKIDQSLANQVELEAAKQKFVNKLERDRKLTMGGILLIISILIGVIISVVVVLIIRAKREKIRLAQQENDELSKNIELRSKNLELSDQELFNEKIKSTFTQPKPTTVLDNPQKTIITPSHNNSKKDHNSYTDSGSNVYHRATEWSYPSSTSATNVIIVNNEPSYQRADIIEPSRRYEKPDENNPPQNTYERAVSNYLEEERKEAARLSEEKNSISESKSIFNSDKDFSDSSCSDNSSSSNDSSFSDSGYSND